MSEVKKNKSPILPMFIALILLTVIFYVQSESKSPDQNEQEELAQTSMGLPEEKIIRFVVDKFADVMRLFPQKAQVKMSD
jgi:hypothetical protein